MSYNIRLKPSDVTFSADSDATVLEAALGNNVNLDYSCKNGDCGSCSASLISGSVKLETGECITSGVFLTCRSFPMEDLQIEAEYHPELAEIPINSIPVKVNDVQFVAEDVLKIKLRSPPASKLKYLAGQYLNLSYRNVVRSYSIANSCGSDGELELHIKRAKNGKMSALLFEDLKDNTLMRINGPIGTFFIREAVAPILFLATGTGFAPVKAMIEEMFEKRTARKIYFFWGARTESGLYSTVPEEWAKENLNFNYIPVLSQPSNSWRGQVGYVQSAVFDSIDNVSNFHVYACGSPNMIEDAKQLLVSKGLNEKDFHSDAFTAAKT